MVAHTPDVYMLHFTYDFTTKPFHEKRVKPRSRFCSNADIEPVVYLMWYSTYFVVWDQIRKHSIPESTMNDNLEWKQSV